MTNARYLTFWQRIRRRVALLSGSYTHPDGFIELDFDEPSGIDIRNDSDALQAQKLDRLHRRKSEDYERATYFVYGLIAGAALIRRWPSLWPF
jgi:hypothetical protein